MNRNYDPLARYPYKNEAIREKIIANLDQREIEYIVNYSIDPDEFIKYIDNYEFNAFHIDLYSYASKSLYNLEPSQIVNVVEKMLSEDYDLDLYLNKFAYLNYEEIMYYIVNGYK